MNGYTLMKESYRKLLEQKKISEEEAMKKIRVYEFLETCDKEDINIIADSSALNDIIRGYCNLAIEQGGTRGIFDAMNASDARRKCYRN